MIDCTNQKGPSRLKRHEIIANEKIVGKMLELFIALLCGPVSLTQGFYIQGEKYARSD